MFQPSLLLVLILFCKAKYLMFGCNMEYAGEVVVGGLHPRRVSYTREGEIGLLRLASSHTEGNLFTNFIHLPRVYKHINF